MIKEILKALEEKHGKKLDPKNESYYLFVKDGVVRYTVEDDENDEPTIVFEVKVSAEGVQHNYEDKSISLQELMKKGGL